MIKQLENLTLEELNALDLFTPDNTEWVTDEDEDGHVSRHLVYTGELSDLVSETSFTEKELEDALSKYEDISNAEIDEQNERTRIILNGY